jgi:hypothetical protein
MTSPPAAIATSEAHLAVLYQHVLVPAVEVDPVGPGPPVDDAWPWAVESFRRRLVYFISGSPHRIYYAASE